MHLEFIITTIFIGLIGQINGKLTVEHDVISCNLENKNVWNIYKEHFSVSRFIQLKVLTLQDREQNGVLDFAISIVQSINSMGLLSTMEVVRYSIKPTGYSKDLSFVNVSLKPKECRRRTGRTNSVDTNTFVAELKELCLIIVYDTDTLFEFVHKQLKNIFSDPLLRYIIVFTSEGFECNQYSNDIARILVKLWKTRRILNVIANAPCSCHPKNFYIYRPFRKTGGNGRGLVEITSTDQIVNQQSFLINQAKNLHGASLRVSAFRKWLTFFTTPIKSLGYSPIYSGNNTPKFYGIDGMILQEIAKYMNFEILIDDINSDFGTLMDNGIATGSLGKVIRKYVDLSANSRFIEHYHPDFEYTYPIFTDQLCVVVPKSRKMPTFLAVLLCFDVASWLGIFATIVVSIMVWYIHKKIMGQEDGAFLQIYSIFIGVSINIPMRIRLSILILVCCFANIIFSNLFQGSLYTYFSKATYFDNIHTLEDLVHSSLSISTSSRVFEELDTDVYNELRNKVVNTSDINTSALNRVAFNGNTAVLKSLSDAKQFVNNRYLDEEGNPRLHIVDECIRSYFLAYITPSGSPYIYYINYVLSKLTEAGLTKKWLKDIINAIELESQNILLQGGHSGRRKLNNEDLYIAYIVLLTGYIFSILIFLKEIYFNH